MLPELSGRSVRLRAFGGGWEVRAGDARARLEVLETAAPTPGQLSARGARQGVVVVADRLSRAVREELQDLGASWWDKRGHLHLEAPGIFIDTTVSAVAGVAGAKINPGRPSAPRVWLEVVTAVLADPERRHGPRELERQLGRAVSAVSKALSDLTERALLTRAGLPLLPDLFWEAAGQWQADVVPVARRPKGAVLTDSQAAAAWGAPMVGDAVPRYFVGDVQEAVRELGEATWGSARAHVAQAPVPLALERHGRAGLAHPLIVALDLAQDAARGRETLQLWTPPSPWSRVW